MNSIREIVAHAINNRALQRSRSAPDATNASGSIAVVRREALDDARRRRRTGR